MKQAVWCFLKQCVWERRDISCMLHELLKSVRARNDTVKKKTAMQLEQDTYRAHQLIMGSFQTLYEVSRGLFIFRVEGNPVLMLHCAAWLGASRETSNPCCKSLCLLCLLPVEENNCNIPKTKTRHTHICHQNGGFETCGEDYAGGRRPLLVFDMSNLWKPHRFQSVLMLR